MLAVILLGMLMLQAYPQFAMYDWCWTPTMDSRNPDHVRLATLFEECTAMPHRPISEWKQDYIRDALRSAQFEVEVDDLAESDRSLYPSQAVVPWYETLEAAIKDPHTVWASRCNDRCGRFGQITRSAAELMVETGKLGVCCFICLLCQ